jgi:hypothetical protein
MDGNTHDIQCYECSGYVHNIIKCSNFPNAKGKSLNACMSDK